MIYELFLEGQLADIRQDLGMQLSYNIDDINKYGSRDTSFSKTIVLPGTARNNKLFGFVGELGSNNPYAPGAANINVNFNVAQTTKAELRANGLLLLKGVFRLTGIIHERGHIEYEGNLFGELGGFIAAIGRGKLEDLDFNIYNHTYTRDNIVNSWDNKITQDILVTFFPFFGDNMIIIKDYIDRKIKPNDQITITNAASSSNNKTYTVNTYVAPDGNAFGYMYVNESILSTSDDIITISYPIEQGKGYYYPLIDYGTYSADKINYDYRTFRPALYVKEYIDKIFALSGYTYESNFFDSSFFKKLIIPVNAKELKALFTDLLDVALSQNITFSFDPQTVQNILIGFNNENLKRSFTGNGDPDYTYTSQNSTLNISFKISGFINWFFENAFLKIELFKNQLVIKQYYFDRSSFSIASQININDNINVDLLTNDKVYFKITYLSVRSTSYINIANLFIKSINPIVTDVLLNQDVLIKYNIPKNILQKDFFTWIMKMFNLYITEDKVREKHLLIEPYIDYYDLTESTDWTYKVARDKAWNIKPMGMLTSRFYEYKYKDDSDFYNDSYKKKFNLPYGSNLQDTNFQFAKEKQTLEIGFSPSVLVGYQGRDKIVSALYKRTSGTAVQQEERMDTNIRIMMAKKITGVTSWRITNNGSVLGAALTAYGYAGHFDDPVNPTKDINFGAASEIYFDPNTYPTNNLFNDYWSAYIAEIADKDSKILSCHVYLNDLDIAQLDFSKPVFIDGVLWRINKVIDYDSTSGELTKVELLKVINNG